MTSASVGFGAWVGATSIGWVLGVPAIAGLALVGEALGIGGVQVLVGAGMGLAVGALQGRVVRRLGVSWRAWTLSAAAGLAVPFLIWDVARRLGYDPKNALYACVAAGGLIVGAWQTRLLRSRLARQSTWVVASVLGWAGASVSVALADRMFQTKSIRGILGLVVYLGLIFAGGPILGTITGWALTRSPQEVSAAKEDRRMFGGP